MLPTCATCTRYKMCMAQGQLSSHRYNQHTSTKCSCETYNDGNYSDVQVMGGNYPECVRNGQVDGNFKTRTLLLIMTPGNMILIFYTETAWIFKLPVIITAILTELPVIRTFLTRSVEDIRVTCIKMSFIPTTRELISYNNAHLSSRDVYVKNDYCVDYQ